jgi:hypothetical protein
VSVDALCVSAHTQQRDADIEERRLSLRARVCPDERRETLHTCGPPILDLSTTRPLSTPNGNGLDRITHRAEPTLGFGWRF